MMYPTKTRSLMSLAILPFLSALTYAQTDQQTDGDGMTQEEAAAIAGAQPDTVVARVGSVDIRSTDVMTQIGMLPDRFRSQPPELLIPMAIEQLVLRQLILQEEGAQDLATDPEVQILAEEAAQTARENVLVQSWLERELEDRITQEDVQASYDSLQEESDQELPPLEQIRGQVEQSLRQQEIGTLTRELLQSDHVVFYGADGQPVEGQELDAASSGTDAEASEAGENEADEADEETASD